MSYSKENGQIKKTSDYEMFKFRDDNRDINKNHVNTLVASMKQHNDMHLFPIVVNDDMEIVDGQHRLEACKILNCPVFFVVDNEFTPDKIITVNTTQARWKADDFLNYYIEHGNENYLKLKNLRDDLKFKTNTTLRWLIDKAGGSTIQSFNNGKFKFKISEKLLHSILQTKRFIDFLRTRNFKPEKAYDSWSFHAACKEFFTNPIVDHERFFNRLNEIPFTFYYTNTWQAYLDQFVEIYNYNIKKKRLTVIAEGENRELKINE